MGRDMKTLEQRAADKMLKNKILQLYGRGAVIASSQGSTTAQPQVDTIARTSRAGSSTIPAAPEVSEAAEEAPDDETTDEEFPTFSVRETPRPEGHVAKTKRGLVCGKQAAETVRRNGGKKISVDFDPTFGGSTVKSTWTMFTKDLGAAVRNYVPMIKPSWNELDVDAKLQAFTAVSVFYDLLLDEHEGMFEAVDKLCASVYARWKCRIHKSWEKAIEEGKEASIPMGFQKRKAEWEYLKKHFKEENYLKKVDINTKNRRAKKLNHHAGTMSFGYKTQEAISKKSKAPHMDAWGSSYAVEGNDVAKSHYEKMQEAVSVLSNIRATQYPDTPAESHPPLSIEEEIAIMGDEIGYQKGREVRGMGRAVVRQRSGGTESSVGGRASRMEEELSRERKRVKRLEAEKMQLSEKVKQLEDNHTAFQKFVLEKLGLPETCIPPLTPHNCPDDPADGGSGMAYANPTVDVDVSVA